jgi:hypothetical protein
VGGKSKGAEPYMHNYFREREGRLELYCKTIERANAQVPVYTGSWEAHGMIPFKTKKHCGYLPVIS